MSSTIGDDLFNLDQNYPWLIGEQFPGYTIVMDRCPAIYPQSGPIPVLRFMYRNGSKAFDAGRTNPLCLIAVIPFEMETTTLLEREFHHDGRGPELQRVVRAYEGKILLPRKGDLFGCQLFMFFFAQGPGSLFARGGLFR